MTFKAIPALRVIPALVGMTLIFSCGNDIEKVNRIDNPDTLPAVQASGVEIIVSDSSIVRVKISAPELKEFPVADSLEPKTEFPRGLTATFYNKGTGIESTLQAGYAIYQTKKKMFEASKDVVIRNYAQDQELHSDQLWWDEGNKQIWSDSPIIIINNGDTTYGDAGFNSDENFTRYTIRGSHGQMKVREKVDSTGQGG